MVENGECNMRLAVVSRVSDQALIGPRAVPAQSWAWIRRAISPLPLVRVAVSDEGIWSNSRFIGDSRLVAGILSSSESRLATTKN